MKNIIKTAILLAFIFSTLVYGKESVKISSSAMFEYPTHFFFSKDNAKNSIQTTSSDNEKRGIVIKPAEMEALLTAPTQEFTLTDFPVSAIENKTIHLTRASLVVDANTQWIRVTPEGEIKGKAPKIITFSGYIDGEPDSKLYINLTNDMLFAVIDNQYQERNVILPIMGNSTPNLHLISNESSYLSADNKSLFCDTPQDAFNKDRTDDEDSKNSKIMSNTMMEAEIAIEASSDFFSIFKDYTKCSAYLTAVMSLASKIFENDVYTRLNVTYVIIQEDPTKDPYRSNNQIINRLYMMPSAWKDRNVDRATAVLFTSIANQGGGGYFVGGISMSINTLCNNSNGFCVLGMYGNSKYPTNNYTWDVSVTAHELGHAFGSPHTHTCYFNPPIDTCVTKTLPYPNDDACFSGNPVPRLGTIMSYCHLSNQTHSVGLYFHERNIPVVRRAIEAAKCLRPADQPFVRLMDPAGGNIIYAGSTYRIRWSSALVEYISIKYSTDAGKTWKNVVSYAVEASVGYYDWVVPKITSNEVLVLISDAYSPTIKDQSISNCSIVTPSITITAPIEGDKFGQKEKLTIQWEKKYVDEVDILFSSDGGVKWTSIATNQITTSYKFDMPDIIASSCKIKIVASKDKTVITESGLFAIGVEKAKLLAPKGGEFFINKDTCEIKWESEFITRVYLEYSTDNGTIWKYVRLAGVDAKPQSMQWSIPQGIKSEKCLIRISSYSDKTTIFDQCATNFTIDSYLGVEDKKTVDNEKLQLVEIIPNPVQNNNAQITFTYNSIFINPVRISLVDEKGSTINSLATVDEPKSGINTVSLDFQNIAQGNYLIILKSGTYSASMPIKIVR